MKKEQNNEEKKQQENEEVEIKKGLFKKSNKIFSNNGNDISNNFFNCYSL